MSEKSICWPDDPDYLDNKAEIELPPENYAKVFWHVDILDIDKNKHDTALGTDEIFLVRYRVELRGRLWKCASGTWTFNMGFLPIGPESGRYLSGLLRGDPNLEVKDWKGYDMPCIERVITVPAGTIKIESDSALFEVAATVTLRCRDDLPVVTGHKTVGEYEFLKRR